MIVNDDTTFLIVSKMEVCVCTKFFRGGVDFLKKMEYLSLFFFVQPTFVNQINNLINKFIPSAPQLVKARGNGSDFIKSLELIQTK